MKTSKLKFILAVCTGISIVVILATIGAALWVVFNYQ